MQMPSVYQVLTSVVLPLAVFLLGVRATTAQHVRSLRAEAAAQRLITLADDLATSGRDICDVLFAGDACVGCGTGISARRLIDIAGQVDRTVDLALVHVRDQEMRDRLLRVVRAAAAVSKHRKNLERPCDEMLRDVNRLAVACDRAASSCVAMVHEGRPVPRSKDFLTTADRVLTSSGRFLRRVRRIAA